MATAWGAVNGCEVNSSHATFLHGPQICSDYPGRCARRTGIALALPDDASARVRQLVRWSTATADHQGLPFAVIDKPAARIHVFSSQAQWLGSAPYCWGPLRVTAQPRASGQAPGPHPPARTHHPRGPLVTEPGRKPAG